MDFSVIWSYNNCENKPENPFQNYDLANNINENYIQGVSPLRVKSKG